jgi:hypothetical protein
VRKQLLQVVELPVNVPADLKAGIYRWMVWEWLDGLLLAHAHTHTHTQKIKIKIKNAGRWRVFWTVVFLVLL